MPILFSELLAKPVLCVQALMNLALLGLFAFLLAVPVGGVNPAEWVPAQSDYRAAIPFSSQSGAILSRAGSSHPGQP